jgi:hypothetical protein
VGNAAFTQVQHDVYGGAFQRAHSSTVVVMVAYAYCISVPTILFSILAVVMSSMHFFFDQRLVRSHVNVHPGSTTRIGGTGVTSGAQFSKVAPRVFGCRCQVPAEVDV